MHTHQVGMPTKAEDRTPTPRRFTYNQWSGREKTVTADRITFEPSGHVAFWLDGRLVIAEKREDCGHITEQEATDADHQ